MALATIDTSLLRRIARLADTDEDRKAIERAILQAEARVAERHSFNRAQWFTMTLESAARDATGPDLIERLECFPVLDLLILRQIAHDTVANSMGAGIMGATFEVSMGPTNSQRHALIEVARAIDRCLARLVGEALSQPGGITAHATMLSEAASSALAGEFQWHPAPTTGPLWPGWKFPTPFRSNLPGAAAPGSDTTP